MPRVLTPWTPEEDAWVKERGDKVLAEGLALVKNLPELFRQKFDTHTNLAIVVRYENKYKPRQNKVENYQDEVNESREEAKMLKKYLEDRRKAEEALAEKRKRYQQIRVERLKKIRAQYGGYSVG